MPAVVYGIKATHGDQIDEEICVSQFTGFWLQSERNCFHMDRILFCFLQEDGKADQ